MTPVVIDGVVLTPRMLRVLKGLQNGDAAANSEFLEEIVDFLIDDYENVGAPADRILEFVRTIRRVSSSILLELIPDLKDEVSGEVHDED